MKSLECSISFLAKIFSLVVVLAQFTTAMKTIKQLIVASLLMTSVEYNIRLAAFLAVN